MARLGTPVPVPDDIMEHFEIYDELWRQGNTLPNGQYKGAVIKFTVADGYALYLVDSLKPLVLRHIPLLDAYSIPQAHIRGLTVQDVKDKIDGQRRMSKLFGSMPVEVN